MSLFALIVISQAHKIFNLHQDLKRLEHSRYAVMEKLALAVKENELLQMKVKSWRPPAEGGRETILLLLLNNFR